VQQRSSPDDVREIHGCEVCGNARLESVLDLGLHPMSDDLVPLGDPRACREYPIEIMLCRTCLTAHQRFQITKQDLFPANYHYRSRFTADVLAGMRALVESCERRGENLGGRTVLDIGCNDGSLLDFFAQKGAVTIGLEPTDAADDAAAKGHRTFKAYLSEEAARDIVASHGQAHIVTFTNVFAHIDNLAEVIRALRTLMSPDGLLVIENHYLGAVLGGNQFDTFYHEHPRTYSYTSFGHVARALGVDLLQVEFPSRYGGNIRVFMGHAGIKGAAQPDAHLLAREQEFAAQFATLAQNVDRWRITKRRALQDLVQRHGPLRAKAFPARAAILVKLLGLDEGMISVVHEKPGSMKIGHYVPGTHIPIGSDDELLALADKSQPLVNLAWHISKEIRGYMARQNYTGPIIDVLDPDDFTPEPAS
jgi:SAM-dependent methyltransferase